MNRNNTHLIGNQYAKGNSPNKTSFQKGNVPWNKNLKGIHLSPKSEFKKGNKPAITKLNGDKVFRIDKAGTKRLFIKISDDNWIEYSKYIWSQKYGPIPEGMFIHHIDGNALNNNIANLQSTNRSEHINFHRDKLVACYKAKLSKGGDAL